MSVDSTVCPRGSVQLGYRICGLCPAKQRGSVVEAQQHFAKMSHYHPSKPDTANAARYAGETSDKNIGKSYCGNQAYIRDATLYANCYGVPEDTTHAAFVNPYKYASVGDPSTCFNTGKTVGSFMVSNNSDARRGGRGGRGGGRGRRGGRGGRGGGVRDGPEEQEERDVVVNVLQLRNRDVPRGLEQVPDEDEEKDNED